MATMDSILEPPSGEVDAAATGGPDDAADGESQERSDGAYVRSISDDQKLFLKVLENLKNAVNAKPDNKSVALPKIVKDPAQTVAITGGTSKAFDDTGISQTESTVRSDPEEPGTTTVTVSDKTKSLILQKLAVAGEVDKSKLAFSSFVISSADSHAKDQEEASAASHQSSVEMVKVTVMGYGGNKPGESDGASAKIVKKENIDMQTDKVAAPASVSPKISRLIAPATPSVKLFTCNFCDYYSENKSYLKQHIDLVHNSDRPFKCPYCDYAGKRSHALREHLIVHSDERPYQCKSCNATFRKKGHLTNHIKLHNSKRLVKCPLCKVLVYDTGENGLDVHLLNDHDTERLYGCDLCDHVAANEPGILKHLSTKHKSKVSLHKCEKCPFQTANKLDFEGHVQAHNITDTKVQVGTSAPTKVIGVATIPAGSHNLGLPNSMVKVNPNKDETRQQPAVIKPVWIKCSECGFTGQDSEVIRKHMIGHLKEQYGDDIATTELPEAPNPSAKSVTSTQAVPTPDPQPSVSKPSVNAPILVPMSKKLDMNAPVLVPVSEAAILKSLQSVPVSVVQLTPAAAPAAPMTTARPTNPEMLRNPGPNIMRSTGRSIPSSNIVTLTRSDVAINPASMSTAKFQHPMNFVPPNVATNKPQTVQNLDEGRRVPIPVPVSVKQVQPSTASFKAVPLKVSATEGTLSALNVDIIPSVALSPNAKMASTEPVSGHPTSVPMGTTRNIPTASVPVAVAVTKPGAAPSFTLTEIPVPRAVNTNEIPKLPPEFLQLTPGQPSGTIKSAAKVEVINTTAKATDNRKTEQLLEQHQNIKKLEESIANVQKLIDQNDEYNRQAGTAPLVKLDARGIPEKTSGQKVVYYMTPVGKHNTSKAKSDTAGFTHDNTAGRFRCTLCGYTCEYQRTIKAHIWKHSGNKDIYYPMFQNGPLSIYEEGNYIQSADQEGNIVEIPAECDTVEANATDNSLPSFIVYEETKVSDAVPALAHLLAARTMVGLKDSDNPEETSPGAGGDSEKEAQHLITVNDSISVCVTAEQFKSLEEFQEMEKKRQRLANEGSTSMSDADQVPGTANVIVEAVNSISTTTGFTGLQSQQGSPRVTPAPKSPDSGVSEQTVVSKTDDHHSASSGFVSPSPNFDYIDDSKDSSGNLETNKRTLSQTDKEKSRLSVINESDEGPPAKKAKVSTKHEDSAVTLLSLLKKGPNYNPACPPRVDVSATSTLADLSSDRSASVEVAEKPAQEDSGSVGAESEASGSKPKSGISTSLLAVIEQLRERSKAEPETDDKLQQQGKRQSKRRSRKSSVEDNAPAAGIDNVEEFVADGVVKFRCKLCHYTNDSTVLLRQHMRLHKPKQEFECSLCEHIAESSESLQDHMIQHCKVRIYQCKLCNCAFNYKSQLRAHMRMHNDQDILLCDFCDFETRSASALKAHTKGHYTKPPYKCEMCKEEFITSFNLRIHKREGCYTSIDKTGNFKCDECDYVTTFRREMKNHQRLHMGKSTIPTKKRCPYCDNVAVTIEQIQQHIVDVHGESKPLKCEMCGFVAVSIRSLKSHMKRHVNDQRFVAQPLEQYKCNLCGYVCHHLPSLKSHMWRHAADQHYSYEFTNDVINAAIDFDGQTDAVDTTLIHVDSFKKLIFEKMKAKGLEHTQASEEESALSCCWVTFRCCQCGFETINKAELNMHMANHSDVIKWTLDVTDEDRGGSKQASQILHG